MKITVTTQILDGNLGEGWTDNYEAARALAEFTKKIWIDDLADYSKHDISIHIDVERDSGGDSRGMDVFVDGADTENSYDFERVIKNVLTDENKIWEMFCDSDDALKYIV